MLTYSSGKARVNLRRESEKVSPDSTSSLMAAMILAKLGSSACSARMSRPCISGRPELTIVESCRVNTSKWWLFTRRFSRAIFMAECVFVSTSFSGVSPCADSRIAAWSRLSATMVERTRAPARFLAV